MLSTLRTITIPHIGTVSNIFTKHFPLNDGISGRNLGKIKNPYFTD